MDDLVRILSNIIVGTIEVLESKKTGYIKVNIIDSKVEKIEVDRIIE